MSETYEIWKKPEAKEIYLLAGWRQWADGGSVSSGLPEYLADQLKAERIGAIHPDGFYIFQVPGTHDLVRPVVRFKDGFPESVETQHNDIFYTEENQRGLVILLGDEPHLDIERYVRAVLSIARTLGAKRIIGLGGVYGELPYDKERLVSAIYSRPHIKKELLQLAVTLSDYQGGASIGSYICRRAADAGMEYVGLYAFVPAYDFSSVAHIGSGMRLENDYMAWLGIMRRVDHMLKLHLDLSDLEDKSQQLIKMLDDKVEELEREAPQLGLKEKLKALSAEFKETPFIPLDDVWEEELKHLLDKLDAEDSADGPDEPPL